MNDKIEQVLHYVRGHEEEREAMSDAEIERAREAIAQNARMELKRREKAKKDRARDNMTRTLVGARMPREKAQKVRKAAYSSGVSIYRWVSDAIDKALYEWYTGYR